jgi:hypothetical protein
MLSLVAAEYEISIAWPQVCYAMAGNEGSKNSQDRMSIK